MIANIAHERREIVIAKLCVAYHVQWAEYTLLCLHDQAICFLGKFIETDPIRHSLEIQKKKT